MYFTETHQNNASADLMMLNEALCSGYQMTKFSSIVFCQKMFSFFLAAIVVLCQVFQINAGVVRFLIG